MTRTPALSGKQGITFVLARFEELSILDYLRSIEAWGEWMTAILGPLDCLFYTVAAICGFRFSYNAVADKY